MAKKSPMDKQTVEARRLCAREECGHPISDHFWQCGPDEVLGPCRCNRVACPCTSYVPPQTPREKMLAWAKDGKFCPYCGEEGSSCPHRNPDYYGEIGPPPGPQAIPSYRRCCGAFLGARDGFFQSAHNPGCSESPATPSAAPPQTAAPSLELTAASVKLAAFVPSTKLPAPDAQGGDESDDYADIAFLLCDDDGSLGPDYEVSRASFNADIKTAFRIGQASRPALLLQAYRALKQCRELVKHSGDPRLRDAAIEAIEAEYPEAK